MEQLEDRSVPATFSVNTTLDVVDPGDGKLSLREAITRANTTPGADVIVVPAGVFKMALAGADENGNATGDFDVTDTVVIQGAGRGRTIIDGQQLDRVFDVSGTSPSSNRVVLQGVTVRGGNVTGDGGGVRVGNADLVVRDSALSGNRASLTGGGISNGAATGTGDVKVVRTIVGRNAAGTQGGGLFVFGVNPLTVKDSTVRRNVADGAGGGIDSFSVTLTNSTVAGNVAGDSGGGIFGGTATLTNSTVSGNTAGGDGGGIDVGAAVTLTNSTVSGNSAAGFGGGILATTAVVTLIRSTVSGNTATGNSGGGVLADTANLTNCTVSGNTAGTSAGGIWATTANLLNCTVVENLAQTGGGLFHQPGGTFNVRNTIVALNLVGFTGTGPDVSGAFTSGGHNLIGNGSGSTGFTNRVSGDIVGTSVNPIDPKLGPLANNGGRTKTHALKAGSRAIDRGDNSILPPTDQRGLSRVKDGNFDGIAIVDIGAFER